MLYNQNPKVSLIIIGNEILSGRTRDANTQYVASKLGEVGIELKEVRVIPDIESEIIETVRVLSGKYDYVFTTGGIGPTHDDITAESMAKAFGVELWLDPKAEELLVNYYGGKEHLNPGRLKMAYVPKGSKLIPNPVSIAPGFNIENVFVMAGVPKIMQAMLDNVIPQLRVGRKVLAKTVRVESGESKIAIMLTELQRRNDTVDIGSYPYMPGESGFDHHGTNIVFRSVDDAAIDSAVAEFIKELTGLQIVFEEK